MSSSAQAVGRASAAAAPTASAPARHSTGRTRLPPAVRLYRIASANTRGVAGGGGRTLASARSTVARWAETYAATSAVDFIDRGDRRGRGPLRPAAVVRAR